MPAGGVCWAAAAWACWAQQEESAEPQEEEKPAELQPDEDAIHSQRDSNDPLHYTPLSDPDDSDSEPEPVRCNTLFFAKEIEL
jgi:hypothetical protein